MPKKSPSLLKTRPVVQLNKNKTIIEDPLPLQQLGRNASAGISRNLMLTHEKRHFTQMLDLNRISVEILTEKLLRES